MKKTNLNHFKEKIQTEKFEENLDKSVENLDLKPYTPLWYYFGVAIVFLIFTIVLPIFLASNASTAKDSAIVMPIFMVLTIISIIVLLVKAGKISNYNKKMIMQNFDKTNLHTDFFNQAIETKYPKLEFLQIKESSLYKKGSEFIFKYLDSNIYWNIDEDREMRTRIVSDGKGRTRTETYYVYILKTNLDSKPSKIKKLKKMNISNGKVSNKAAVKNNLFHSESLDFNNKWRIEYEDLVETTKFFSPKLIFNLGSKPKNYLKGNTIQIKDGDLSMRYRSGDNTSSWHPGAYDFDAVSWSKKRFAKTMVNKLSLDFMRFLENFELLEPFNFFD